MAEVDRKNEDDYCLRRREEEDAARDRVCPAFLKERSLVAHQIGSYSRFCDGLPALLNFRETEESELDSQSQSPSNINVRYGNACLQMPGEEAGAPQKEEADTKSLTDESEEQSSKTSRPLMPWEARLRNLSYSAGLDADIMLEEVFLGKIPCMVKSKLCHYSPHPCLPATDFHAFGQIQAPNAAPSGPQPSSSGTEGTNVDCLYDLGASFIVDGAETVVISQEDHFIQRCTVSNKNGWKVFVPTTGLSTFMYMVIVNLHPSEGRMLLYLKLPGAVNVSVRVVFRALGITTDRPLFELLDAVDDDELWALLRPLLTDAVSKGLPTDFRNMEMNLEYIGSKAKSMEETPDHCAVYMGRRSEDGGLNNKRIECVGEIFRDQLKSSMSRFRNELRKRMQETKLPEGILSESLTFDKLIVTKDFEAAFKRNSFWGKF